MSKMFARAESLLLQDKLRDRQQLFIIQKEIKTLLQSFAEFSNEDFVATIDNNLELCVRVKIKSFKKNA